MEIIKKICSDGPNILPSIPEKKITRIIRIFEIPRNFFAIPRNIEALTPQVFVKNINKEKISLEVCFWIWDISMKGRIVSNFFLQLDEEFKKKTIKFG